MTEEHNPAVAGSIRPNAKLMRHAWNEIAARHLAATEFPDGNARTEKQCARCDLLKITVHPPHGLPWTEWRTKGGLVFKVDATPLCEPV